MVATRSTRRRATPLLVLWRRDDARAAVVDFLPTETIAGLAMVAKPLREAQSCLLTTAIKRRGKTAVPNPPTTRALLDALTIGEPKHFCETGSEPFFHIAKCAMWKNSLLGILLWSSPLMVDTSLSSMDRAIPTGDLLCLCGREICS